MNKNNILVSIGIPIFNAEKYLDNAIRSVINQSHTNWELILIDDGSTDNSLSIAKSYSDKRIQVITDGENKGLIYRLNQLITIATGVYYARMDNDDIMHFDRIALQLDYLISHPEVDVVGSSYFSINTINQIIGLRRQNPHPNNVNDIIKVGCFAHPSMMGRTKWFKENPYDKNWERMEDFELWVRTVSYSNFKNISQPLLFYRNVGIPTLRKYIKSNLGILKLLKNWKKYKINKINAIKYYFIYSLKIVVYCIFFSFGQMDYLIKKRTISISEIDKKNAEEVLLKSIR